jgi:hypothetical protein
LAFNLDIFTYQLGINPAFPNQAPSAPVTGEFSEIEETILSMQIGAGLIFHFHQIVTKHSLYYPLCFFPTLFWTKSTCYRNLEYNYNKSWVALKFGQGKHSRSYRFS